jgi:hypothetical protein
MGCNPWRKAMRVLVVLAVALALSVGQVPSSFARRPPPPPIYDDNGQIVFPPGGGCVVLPFGIACGGGDAPKPSKPAKPKPKPRP